MVACAIKTNPWACNFFMMMDNFSPALLLLGYYYDLDESYDESDEEEVKAHLRRVTEQPPLKLDASSEVHEQRGCFRPGINMWRGSRDHKRTV